METTDGLEPLGVGLSLHPDPTFLEMVIPLLDGVDFIEIAPETVWCARGDGTLTFSDSADLFTRLARRFPVAAHGLGLSPGTVMAGEPNDDWQRHWLEMAAASQRRFDFVWYLDHLGVARQGAHISALPLPLSDDVAEVEAVIESVRALRTVNPFAGFENAAWYFKRCVDEPALVARLVEESGAWLLLDAHNVFTQCINGGIDWKSVIDALPLHRVLCMHVSGGSESEPEWLPSGRVMRLDSHDDAVPDTVFDILEYAAHRAPNLRGIVLERMEGTFAAEGADRLEHELQRLRAIWNRLRPNRRVNELGAPPHRDRLPQSEREAAGRRQDQLILAAHAANPRAVLGNDAPPPTESDGLRLTALITQKLRFERLLRGASEFESAFDADPTAFVKTFDRYAREVSPTAFFPSEERALWAAWSESGSSLGASPP